VRDLPVPISQVPGLAELNAGMRECCRRRWATDCEVTIRTIGERLIARSSRKNVRPRGATRNGKSTHVHFCFAQAPIRHQAERSAIGVSSGLAGRDQRKNPDRTYPSISSFSQSEMNH
jgi:hypothetical protein